MTKPLALVSYGTLLPGSRLVHRLEDLGYRVGTVADLQSLATVAKSERPIVVFARTSAGLCESSGRTRRRVTFLCWCMAEGRIRAPWRLPRAPE